MVQCLARGFAMKLRLPVLLSVAALLSGCNQPDPAPIPEEIATAQPSWSVVAPEAMSATEQAQRERCQQAVKALGSGLMAELTEALDSGDPTNAVTTCRDEAPVIASQVAASHGVSIGRTSHRLRNSSNTPPDWALPLVNERVAVPTFLKGPAGELGALLPIRLKAECEMCHGSPEAIDETLLEALRASYPDDRATGFAAGDLRGWFWVEAPPSATAPDA